MDNLTPITREEMLMNDEPMTPITREEKILAGEDLNPVTRREYFLKKYRHAGGDVMVEGLEVTANGTYTAPEGKAYSPVEVAVPLPDNAYLLKTASGSLVSFSDGADLPMPSFVCDIDAVQDLHGYDAPWVGGTGKNKLKVTATSQTTNGVTFTVNADGSVTAVASSKRPGNAWLPIATGINISAGSILSGGKSSDIFIQIINSQGTQLYKNGATEATITEDLTNVTVRLGVYSGIFSQTYTFLPMIRTSGDSSFAPYENICPISGHTGCEVTDNQKNFLVNNIENGYHIITETGIDCIYNGDGTFTGTFSNTSAVVFSANTALSNGGTLATQKDYKKHLPNGDYKFEFYDESSDRFRIQIIAYNDNDTELTVISSAYNGTFTIDDTFKYNYIRLFSDGRPNPETVTLKPMILRVDEEDETYTPYIGQTISVSWQTAAGEVYGGYVDLVSGELTVTDGFVTFDGSNDENWIKHSTLANWFYIDNSLPNVYLDNDKNDFAKCNMYKQHTYTNVVRLTNGEFAIGDLIQRSRLAVKNTNYENVNDFKTALTTQNLQLKYKLATPQTYQLTPQQIKSLLGNNNAWCNTGDVDIDYFAKEV